MLNIRMFPLAHYNKVVNIRRFHLCVCVFVCLCVCVCVCCFCKKDTVDIRRFWAGSGCGGLAGARAWGALGASPGALGGLWAVWGPLGWGVWELLGSLGASGGLWVARRVPQARPQRRLWGVSGGLWGPLGVSGGSWGPLGRFLPLCPAAHKTLHIDVLPVPSSSR